MDRRKTSIKIKITGIALLILCIVISIGTAVSMYTVNKEMEKQLTADGMALVEQMTQEIQNSKASEEMMEKTLGDKIRTVAYLVGKKENISNAYLKEIVKQLNISTINVADASRKVIYSSNDAVLGVEYPSNHPVIHLFEAGEGEIIEKIRKSTDGDGKYYKFGAVALNHNRVVQVGILADQVNEIREKIGKQKIVEEIAQKDNIMYALVIDKKLKITAHNDTSEIGKSVDAIGSKTAAVEGKKFSNKYEWKPGIWAYDVAVPIYENGEHVGAVNIGLSLKNLHDAQYSIIRRVMIVGSILILVGLALLIVIIGRIISPLKGLAELAEKTAKGNLNQQVNIKSNDEIGLLGYSFNHMIDNLREMIEKINHVSSSVLLNTKELEDVSLQVEDVSEQIANATQNVAEGAQGQVEATNEAARNIKDIVTNIEDVQCEITKVVEYANETNKIVLDGEEKVDAMAMQIDKITGSVSSSSNIINELEFTSNEIGNIVDMINGIANQTNLLALNASIEAARAGEAGRGFTVVAEEIRNLAEDSMKSADNIKNLIDKIQDKTKEALYSIEEGNKEAKEGKDVLKEVLDSFKNIVEGFNATKNSLDKASGKVAVVNEKSEIIIKNIQAIEDISEQFSANAEEVAASTQEQTASIESVVETIHDLENMIKELGEAINKFEYKK
ncbi:methyl-accepting chemotaxis protein [Crassaminicella profunda]|uniref:methyl-accepting chemotaxis protein n=1 Tax=Crassaminicella profunda TaxID=1286698 RepID=UPI001CA6A3AA|nr:methyl-accepting chemotaxis protein [Crassaminicella profunda]QZY54899.1 methyl-accepting chemotaxis protein [Crassaminicella profunda]